MFDQFLLGFSWNDRRNSDKGKSMSASGQTFDGLEKIREILIFVERGR
jgi:hypothetical protein